MDERRRVGELRHRIQGALALFQANDTRGSKPGADHDSTYVVGTGYLASEIAAARQFQMRGKAAMPRRTPLPQCWPKRARRIGGSLAEETASGGRGRPQA